MHYLYLFTMKHKTIVILEKKNSNKQSDTFAKGNKTVQETKTKRCIKFPEQKPKNQYFKSFEFVKGIVKPINTQSW